MKTLVLYDGGCSLCAREINHYMRLKGADKIHWLDINNKEFINSDLEISYKEAMKRLHARDCQGQWHTGVYAFRLIWSHLVLYRHIATIFKYSGLLSVMDFLYQWFARWRYRRRCNTGTCSKEYS